REPDEAGGPSQGQRPAAARPRGRARPDRQPHRGGTRVPGRSMAGGAQAVKGVAVLGAIGSIGLSTLDVLARHPDRFRLVAVTGNRRVDRIAGQCLAFRPRYAAMADAESADKLRALLSKKAPEVEILAGEA